MRKVLIVQRYKRVFDRIRETVLSLDPNLAELLEYIPSPDEALIALPKYPEAVVISSGIFIQGFAQKARHIAPRMLLFVYSTVEVCMGMPFPVEIDGSVNKFDDPDATKISRLVMAAAQDSSNAESLRQQFPFVSVPWGKTVPR